MADADKIGVDDDGRVGIGAAGKAQPQDCSDCCGSTHTCTRCLQCTDSPSVREWCCISDESTVDLSITAVTFASCEDCDDINGVSRTGIPFSQWDYNGSSECEGATWEVTDDVGDGTTIKYTVTQEGQVRGCDGPSWHTTVIHYDTDDTTELCKYTGLWTSAVAFEGIGTCCGSGSVSTANISVYENSECFESLFSGGSVDVKNNLCCECDVSSSPLCIESIKDYENDCDGDGKMICDQYTGNEANCDDAP